MTWAAPLGYTGRSVVVGRGRWCWSFGCGLHTNAVLRRATEFIMTQYTTPTVPEKGPLGSCFFGFCANAQGTTRRLWRGFKTLFYTASTCTFCKRGQNWNVEQALPDLQTTHVKLLLPYTKYIIQRLHLALGVAEPSASARSLLSCQLPPLASGS